jgi:hypothetical protein
MSIINQVLRGISGFISARQCIIILSSQIYSHSSVALLKFFISCFHLIFCTSLSYAVSFDKSLFQILIFSPAFWISLDISLQTCLVLCAFYICFSNTTFPLRIHSIAISQSHIFLLISFLPIMPQYLSMLQLVVCLYLRFSSFCYPIGKISVGYGHVFCRTEIMVQYLLKDHSKMFNIFMKTVSIIMPLRAVPS